MAQQSNTSLGESFNVFDDSFVVDTALDRERDPILSRYSINGASPAVPQLVRFEQRVISADVEARLISNTPMHFPKSMKDMLRDANGNTFALLSVENQCSYAAASDQESSSVLLELARMKYERGLATPKEALDTVLDLQANSGELLKRTEFSQQMPDGLCSDFDRLMAVVEQYQGPLDRTDVSRRSVKVKQIDTPIGSGGANGLILSAKSDVATIRNGEYTLTCRTKFLVDFDQLPMKWRSQLRKLIASVEIREKADVKTASQAMGMAALRELSGQSSLDDHIQCFSGDAKEQSRDSESARMIALQEQLLDCPNPEGSGETLRSIAIDKPYAYHFTTTAYIYRGSSKS